MSLAWKSLCLVAAIDCCLEHYYSGSIEVFGLHYDMGLSRSCALVAASQVQLLSLDFINIQLNCIKCIFKIQYSLVFDWRNGGVKSNDPACAQLVGMTEVEVRSFEETMKLLEEGSQGRTTGSTAMNNSSSRSHAIFTIYLDRKNKKDRQV